MFQVTRQFCSMASIKNVTVIGGGQMGSGIAQVVAQSGQNVSVIELNEKILKICRNNIATNLKKVAKKLHKDNPENSEQFVVQSLGRIEFSNDLKAAANKADLVIEAVTENLKLKQDIFASIDKVAPEKTIFATNTSSIPVKNISVGIDRKDRFAGVHFFNPVPVMKLIELVKTDTMSEATFSTLWDWVKEIGKTPIRCKDTPGFIVNRLLFSLLVEAIKMYERGDADFKDIDLALKLGLNHPMGPIELADWIGHDTIVESNKVWRELDPENPMFAPLKSQLKLVEEGKLGYKTGEGYYKYK